MTIDLMEPFTEGAREMLSIMLGLECGHHSITGDPQAQVLAGYMDLVGAVKGRLVLSFTRDDATRFVGEMLAMESEEIDDEILGDGVGEMVNIVAGVAKARLSATPHAFDLTVPGVVFGESLVAGLTEVGAPVSENVKTDIGEFMVSVWFDDG